VKPLGGGDLPPEALQVAGGGYRVIFWVDEEGGRCCGIATRRRVASGFDTLEAITPGELPLAPVSFWEERFEGLAMLAR
jgi:hypothetical protein